MSLSKTVVSSNVADMIHRVALLVAVADSIPAGGHSSQLGEPGLHHTQTTQFTTNHLMPSIFNHFLAAIELFAGRRQFLSHKSN